MSCVCRPSFARRLKSRHIRRQLGLTQDRLAAWLGLRRGTLAISATGLRGLPPGMGLPLARLGMAWLAQVLLPNGQAASAPGLARHHCAGV